MRAGGIVTVDGRGARRARRGHPWIFSDNVVKTEDAEHGELVRVVDRGGASLAWAAWSSSSRIGLRLVSRGEDVPDAAFWSARLDAAIAWRRQLGELPAQRLIHADADGFPGLTVDRYDTLLVVQATTAWAAGAGIELTRELGQRVGATAILGRHDAPARSKEELPREVVAHLGEPPEQLWVVEAGHERPIDPWRGHKTGFYLDQQENHRQAPTWLSGRVLDLFCGEGGFALPLAAAGAEVVAVDQNQTGLERGALAVERARAAHKVEWRRANAFDVLAAFEREGERFDGIVLDPPPFARSRGALRGAERGYRDLHRRALRLLEPGGRLLTFTCSHAVSDESFEALVREGAEEARVELRVLGRPGPAPDHPERLALPESRYLRGLLVEVTR